VKLIKLKRTQTVCIEKERKRERNRGKTEREESFVTCFFKNNELPPKKKIEKYRRCPGDLVNGNQGSHLRYH
jgi:hypothetical protein